MKFSKLSIVILLVAALFVGAGGMYVGMSSFSKGSSTSIPNEHGGSTNASFAKVKQAYQVISENYYKNVDKKKLLNGAIQGMVHSLGDRFSVYMDPATARQFTQSLSSSYGGIGAQVSMVNGKVTIMSPFKGSPADKAGLRANDQIVSINGKRTSGLSLYQAVQMIRGKKGTTVKLGVKHPGSSDVMHVDLIRGAIPVQTVHKATVKKDGHLYGIINIASFSRGTADEFTKALKSLQDQGIDGLVIDVRGNPGGYLGSVTQIADELVPNDKPIVQVEDRNGHVKRYYSNRKKKRAYPIVGLINGGSASAAEILSAALQQAGGYPLVGTTSFGKGTVQTEFDIGQGRLKLTIMKWLTPDGNWINKKGITPNVTVKQPKFYYAQPVTVKKGKVLKLNDNNQKVKNAQIMLDGLGFGTGRDDGYFNKQTEVAVKAFQKMNHLQETGKIDAKTASALDQRVMKAADNKKNDLQLQTALQLLEKHQ